YDGQVRRCAAGALGKIGPPAAEALPALSSLLAEQDVDLRCVAVEAVARVGAPAEVIARLRPLLRDRQGQVRSIVLKVVARLAADARPALPELLYLLRTEDDYFLGGELHRALAALAAHEPGVVDRLREALREPEPVTRRNALATLALIPKDE